MQAEDAAFLSDGETRTEISSADLMMSIKDQSIIGIPGRTLSNPSGNHDDGQTILTVKASKANRSGYMLSAIKTPDVPQELHKAYGCDLHPPQLQKRIHVIISTRSGTGLAEAFFEDVVGPFLAFLNRDPHQVHKTTSEKTVTELGNSIFLPQAREGVPQTIILLAGDGGIVDLVNVFQPYVMNDHGIAHFCKPTIALIPMGTGNALANSTGINSDATYGLRSLLQGWPLEIPTFEARFTEGSKLLIDEGRKTEELPWDDKNEECVMYGAVVCSWGLHASLVADSDTTEYRKYGSERFTMAAKALLSPSDGSPPHVYSGAITPFYPYRKLDPFEPEHMYILATMVSNLEQKLRISPDSRPLDGQMWLLHFGPISGERVMDIMGQAFSDGTHVKDEEVTYMPIDGLRIDMHEQDAHWRRVCIDGKIVEVGYPGSAMTMKKCNNSLLNLLVIR